MKRLIMDLDNTITLTEDGDYKNAKPIASVIEKLKEYNIFARKYFYPLTSNFECYKDIKNNEENLKNSKYISDRVMTLPLYEELKIEDIEYICEALKEIKINNKSEEKDS